MIQPPSVGRIVLYQDGREQVYPAIVLKVHSLTCVDLHVFGLPDDLTTHRKDSVEQSYAFRENTWCWPPRVEPVVVLSGAISEEIPKDLPSVMSVEVTS